MGILFLLIEQLGHAIEHFSGRLSQYARPAIAGDVNLMKNKAIDTALHHQWRPLLCAQKNAISSVLHPLEIILLDVIIIVLLSAINQTNNNIKITFKTKKKKK